MKKVSPGGSNFRFIHKFMLLDRSPVYRCVY